MKKKIIKYIFLTSSALFIMFCNFMLLDTWNNSYRILRSTHDLISLNQQIIINQNRNYIALCQKVAPIDLLQVSVLEKLRHKEETHE